MDFDSSDSFIENIARYRRIHQGAEAYGAGSTADQATRFYLDQLLTPVTERSRLVSDPPRAPVHLLISLCGFTPLPTILAYQLVRPQRMVLIVSKDARGCRRSWNIRSLDHRSSLGRWVRWLGLMLPVGHDFHLLVEEVGEGDGFVAVGALSTDADAAGEGVALVAALFAEEPFPAAGAFVDGDGSPGSGSGDDEGGGVWWRRRKAVFRQGVLQYCCRPLGVKEVWQTGQVIVAGSSRDGVGG